MTTGLIAALNGYPKDERTGLTLPLTRSLGSQELGEHRAMIAVELEVLAKKFDRFGWERDRGSLAHDRLMLDWMDALQDYPLDEVRAACKSAVIASPKNTPNEGDIVDELMEARKRFVQSRPKVQFQEVSELDLMEGEERKQFLENRRKMAEEVIAAAGFKRFGGDE